jgi:DNA-binding LacI/PurR family transcriptional regulator
MINLVGLSLCRWNAIMLVQASTDAATNRGERDMPSLRQVADMAGVSITTASKILNVPNGSGRFTPACIAEVEKAARELNYHANYHARSLLRGKAQALGGVFTGGRTGYKRLGWYFADILSGVHSATKAASYELALIGPTDEESAVRRGLRDIRQHRIDALTTAGNLVPPEDYPLLVDLDAPLVLMKYREPTILPILDTDEVAGTELMAEHLATLGHGSLLWLGPRDSFGGSAQRRHRAFAGAAQERGLASASCLFDTDSNRAQFGPPYVRGAYRALSDRLARSRDFTAVACYSDDAALGALAAIRDAGLKVPADLSLIGYDNHQADSQIPSLTTIDAGLFELGVRAAELMRELAEDADAAKRLRGYREMIAPHLVVRESTAPPKAD